MNLRELSEKLGLSQTTVSRALNGYPEVNAKTRARVVEAAEQYNYAPSSRAQSLATGRSMMMGHVVPVSHRLEMVNPIFGDFMAGASQTYSKAGYNMMISLVEDGEEEDVYRSLVAKGTVDGIIVHAPRTHDARIDLLNQIGVPYVVHGRSTGVGASYSWVDTNNRGAFHRATRFLQDLGHQRIALLNGLEHMDFAQRRRQGYIEALAEKGLEADPSLMASSEMTEVYGHHATRDMLRRPNPPTAILSASMIAALGVRRAIEEAGLKMGEDISVITHDDDLSYLANGQDVPIFTATRSSVREAGRLSAEALLRLSEDRTTGPITTLLEAELIVGRSTGPAPASF
jgi:LacI family transcriptional regulator